MAILPAGRLNAKYYIVAGLTATLFTAAIITVVFVVMSPARIHFSVTRADHRGSAGGRLQLRVALAANNPSRRASVKYEIMYVDFRNSTSSTTYLSANVTTPMPLRQPTRNVTNIAASLSLVGGPWIEAFTGNMSSELVVTVTAVARFKVGVAWTRLYDLKVSCGPFDFFSAAGPRRRRGQSSAAGFPVDCKTI